MKKLAVLLFLSIYSLTALAQDAGKITGIWWNEDKTTKIRVELKDGKYTGTIIYMIPEKYENGEEPKDDKNPDPALQSRSLIGLRILDGFVYNEKKSEWKDGTIYDPASGKTYDCFARLESNDLMKLRGFVAGLRMLGRTSQWFRTTL
ncbi:MAG: DUF2147 domain-containing protein [Bacteroidales bacterium]|nr:DUF2147 domain-containing protein [Bacteroidales bacterium]MDD4029807.1 DUF2147 domain-containing protein [Bacteroidales bacterium]MDD4434894.1 DUF2147 domain-containing protein [Bacteroidales bacterium]MDD5732845.1 DUF2147 domain-containing protein [Bacteroidales bacterium]